MSSDFNVTNNQWRHYEQTFELYEERKPWDIPTWDDGYKKKSQNGQKL